MPHILIHYAPFPKVRIPIILIEPKIKPIYYRHMFAYFKCMEVLLG